jgi:hypothetical protein
MDITGVFIRIRGNTQTAYVYILYQRSFEEMMANKETLNARLCQTWSSGVLDISYHDIGTVFETIVRNVPTTEMVFSATQTHVVLKSKYDPLVYQKLHENPFGTEIKEIHHRLHDKFAQMKSVSELQKATPETFAETLAGVKR